MQEMSKTNRRTLDGVVVSNKCDKTVVVNVVRRFKHSKYSKFVHESKRYHAHDSENQAKIGDRVTIIESKPISKTKKWVLKKIN
jgi:small subunit ribosomal protein S17